MMTSNKVKGGTSWDSLLMLACRHELLQLLHGVSWCLCLVGAVQQIVCRMYGWVPQLLHGVSWDVQNS